MVSRKNKSFQKHSFLERAAFQNFIVGRSNQVVWASAKYVSNNPGKYSPLFIYGSEGLGKTHLLLAVRNDMLSKNKKTKVLYVPAEKFYDDAMNAIKSGSLAYFWNKYGELDALLVDDMQFLLERNMCSKGFYAYSIDFMRPINKSYLPAQNILRSLKGWTKASAAVLIRVLL